MTETNEKATLQAAIDAKVDNAIQAFADEHFAGDVSQIGEEKTLEVIKSIEFTDEERELLGMQGLEIMVQVALGERIITTLKNHNCNVHRDDLIPCIQAYFAAVDAGEIEAVA